MSVLHRIMIKKSGMPGIWELERRLREHGLTPTRGEIDEIAGTAVEFLAPLDVDLDFLRPDFLPPKKISQ